MIKHMVYLSLLVVAATFSLVQGWSRYSNYERYAPSRRSLNTCVKQNGKCFASEQCCLGYVCAAYDEYFGKDENGLNPEVPGYCVKEKDLRPCMSSSDCLQEERCKRLGKEFYCVSRMMRDEDEEEEVDNLLKVASSLENEIGDKTTGKGLGMECKTSQDCRSFTKDGKDRLCCQKVRRYRQKTKVLCDRVTAISECLP